jgi:Zn-dependent protease with chaperone function
VAPDLPPERTAFFEFQARNRRASWQLGAVCALVIGGGGGLSALAFAANFLLVLFALVFIPSVLLLGVGALAMLTPVTGVFREPVWDLALFLMRGFDLVQRLGPGEHPAALGTLVVGLPLGSWLAVRSVWLAAGVGETLLAIGAREPAPGDLEERQLVNIVEETAIAAGVPAPRVRLLDASIANAAAVGADAADAYLVVGRRLLDEFDRDETQGVLAHLVGSIGNGDLRGAVQIHAMLYVLELMIVVVLAPFARFPRGVARQWLAFPFLAPFRSPARRAERAHVLIRLLQQHRGLMRAGDVESGRGLDAEYFGPVGRVVVRVVPPLTALVLLCQVVTGFLLLFASVPVALLWRSRRYLADATAVQLTRNPTALYRALAHLAECGALIPGGEGVSHLFIIGPEVLAAREDRRRQQALNRWVETMRSRARGRSGNPASAGALRDQLSEAWRASGELRRDEAPSRAREAASERGTLAEREGLLMGMHPVLHRRLRRLVRMGAVPPEASASPPA